MKTSYLIIHELPVADITEPPRQPTGEIIALDDAQNMVSVPEESDKKLKKDYIIGKYRTVVIVFEGRVLVSPYDEEGVKEKEGVALTAGQKATHEEEVK